MAVQIPSDALGAAAAILSWSFICLSTSSFLIFLVWVHGERLSYVALLGFFSSLSIIASIIQQIHTIARWNDIKTGQWQNIVDNVGNPELNITGASQGLDLVVFYIQYYSYNVESMLVLFWAAELAHSVFQIQVVRRFRLHGSLVAKATAIFIPVIQQIMLRQPALQGNTFGYMVLADFIMISSFGIGCILLIIILIKYVHARVALISWNFRYGQESGGTSGGSALRSGTGGRVPRQPRMKAIYDRWLLVRFTIAFVALGVFELVVINFQLRAASTNTVENIPPEPDLSAGRAIADFILFLPGVCAGPLTFIVFGTTRTFRDYMAKLFLPKSWNAKLAARRARKRKPSAVGTPGSGLPRYPPPSNPGDLEAGHGNGVRMQDFGKQDYGKQDYGRQDYGRSKPSEDWGRNGSRRGQDSEEDELPIMKPLPPDPPGAFSALRSHPP